MKRRLLGVVLALCMVIGLMPTALATEEGPSPTGLPSPFDSTKDTITLTTGEYELPRDITKNIKIPTGEEVTIDLNGFTLTNKDSHTILNKGKLTIKDSSTNGTGTVDNVTHGKAALYNDKGATVTILNGNFTRSAEASTDSSSSGGNSYYCVFNKGTMDIQGGNFKFSDTNKGYYSSLVINRHGQLSISDGTFVTGFIAVKNDENLDEGNGLTITGGTFTGDDQAVQNWGNADLSGGTFNGDVYTWGGNFDADDQEVGKTVISGTATVNGDVASVQYLYNDTDATVAATTEIKGGTVTGDVFTGKSGYPEGATPAVPSVVAVSGGVFSKEVDKEFLTDGFTQVKGEDGKYTVATLESVTLNKTTLDLYVGGTETLTATLAPEGAVESVIWSSDKEAVATVEDGKVTAVAPGTATITAKAGEKTATCTVTVKPLVPATGLTISEETITLTKNQQKKLIATVTPATSTDTVAWSSSDEYIASVDPDNGIVTAVASGTATITAKAGEKTATCIVNVVCCTVGECTHYPDVDAAEWYHPAVDFVTEEKIMQGHDTGNFGPEESLTRAQMAQILYNSEAQWEDDEPALGSTVINFTDVKAGEWYEKAIKWASSNGIVEGDGDNTFRPDDPVTRQEMVAMLYRYVVTYLHELPLPADGDNQWKSFPDYEDVADWATTPFAWAVHYGIINGDDGKLNPTNTATRGQAAKIVMVALTCE